MRHGDKINNLGRKSAHRKSMLANMAGSLILSKRIETTVAKAKALRVYVEPLLTKAKENTTHSRRMAFAYLKNKEVIKELFGIVAEKISNRPGGYTRILKTGFRHGDAAEMAMIELVDFNDLYNVNKKSATVKKRATRRGKNAKKEDVVLSVESQSQVSENVSQSTISEVEGIETK